MKEIDMRGQNCPKPVIMTKKALEQNPNEDFTTIVDNMMAKENVSKLLKNLNIEFSIEEKDGNYYISGNSKNLEENGRKEDRSIAKEAVPKGGGNIVVMIDKDKMGHGNDELGDVLIKGFIYTLTEMEQLPSALLFVNAGINLTTTGSEVLSDIEKLEELGVEVLSCGTCLDYYEKQNDLKVGSVTNMYTIVEKLMSASNTIKI